MNERTKQMNVWCGIFTRNLAPPQVARVNGNMGGFTCLRIYKDAFLACTYKFSVISLYILAFACDSLALQK